MATIAPAPKRVRERAWLTEGYVVAGVDEVGRGAWAGPLVAAAVVCHPHLRLRGVRDSKRLTAEQREKIAVRIRQTAQAVGLGVVAIEDINRYGLAWAIRQSGQRAVESLTVKPGRILLDGRHNYLADSHHCETIIGGDGKEFCIAAASIVAKVARDQMMVELDRTYPGYGFGQHKGYGTAEHRRALADHGVSPVHRTGYAPIKPLL